MREKKLNQTLLRQGKHIHLKIEFNNQLILSVLVAMCNKVRYGGLMASVLVSGSSSSGFEPWKENFAVLLGKALYFRVPLSLSFITEFNAGRNPAIND